MTHSRLRNAAMAVLAASFAATTMPASAQPRPPIVVTSCTVLRADRVTQARPFWWPYGPTVVVGTPVVDGIRIVYMNVGPVAANRVAFRADYRGDRQRIIDAGTFAPNVTIDHTFGAFSGDAFLGPNPNSCVAIAARFIDGTTWRATP